MRNYKSTHIQYQIPKDYLSKVNIVSTMPTLVIIAEQSPEQNLFLHKILASVQLVDQQNTNIEVLKKDQVLNLNQLKLKSIQEIISFGIEPNQFMLNGFELKHHIYEFEGLKWLFCYEIQTYQTDETKKRQLWNALKTLKPLK